MASEPRRIAAVPNDGVYDEYSRHRRPASFADRHIEQWHDRLYQHADAVIGGLVGRSILEIGVGWGYFARVARRHGATYEGLEMNAALADELRGEGFAIRVGAVPPFPDDLAAVDVVWMSHVLEHARDWQQARDMMQGSFEALKPGGHVCVICPDILSSKGEFWNGDWSHGYPTSPRRCAQLLHEVGFDDVDVATHVAGVFSPAPRIALGALMRLLPVSTIDALMARALGGRTFAYSFMTIWGWRQVFAIGRRPT